MKIKLTALGGQLVGYFDIPGYNPMPDVVTWGTRVFKMRVDAVGTAPDDPRLCKIIPAVSVDPRCQLVYDETFCVALVGERKDE